MTSLTRPDDVPSAVFTETDLRNARFAHTDLSHARFVGADLSGVVMRGVEIQHADIDSPWLFEGENTLRINGIDVLPFVEAELDRLNPGRELRRATDPEGLHAAWAALEATWAATLERVAAMPPGTVDVAVDGEWTFAEALRHLVLATDLWLGQTILGIDQPFHPLGLQYRGAEGDGHDLSVFTQVAPSYDEVLAVRAGRVAMVRDVLAAITADDLTVPRTSPHDADHQQSTLSCLHVILTEEWDHHRYAVRDLDAIEARPRA